MCIFAPPRAHGALLKRDVYLTSVPVKNDKLPVISFPQSPNSNFSIISSASFFECSYKSKKLCLLSLPEKGDFQGLLFILTHLKPFSKSSFLINEEILKLFVKGAASFSAFEKNAAFLPFASVKGVRRF